MKNLKFLALFLIILTVAILSLVACEDCQHQWDEGYVAKAATDKEEGQKIFTCTLCGEAKSEEIPKLVHTSHDYSKTTWGYDDRNHWLICDYENCKAMSGKGVHVYSNASKDDGLICIVCRSVSNAHIFTGNQQFDNKYHWISCDEEGCPTKKFRESHTLDEGGNCTGCGYSITVTE